VNQPEWRTGHDGRSGGRIDADRPRDDDFNLEKEAAELAGAAGVGLLRDDRLIEVRRRPKVPEFVKNLAIVAVIFVFIWVMKHS
jgi:hypothetical protein